MDSMDEVRKLRNLDVSHAGATPMTDALYAKHHPAQAMPDMHQSYRAFVDHARRLERDRAELRDVLEGIIDALDSGNVAAAELIAKNAGRETLQKVAA